MTIPELKQLIEAAEAGKTLQRKWHKDGGKHWEDVSPESFPEVYAGAGDLYRWRIKEEPPKPRVIHVPEVDQILMFGCGATEAATAIDSLSEKYSIGEGIKCRIVTFQEVLPETEKQP